MEAGGSLPKPKGRPRSSVQIISLAYTHSGIMAFSSSLPVLPSWGRRTAGTALLAQRLLELWIQPRARIPSQSSAAPGAALWLCRQEKLQHSPQLCREAVQRCWEHSSTRGWGSSWHSWRFPGTGGVRGQGKPWDASGSHCPQHLKA